MDISDEWFTQVIRHLTNGRDNKRKKTGKCNLYFFNIYTYRQAAMPFIKMTKKAETETCLARHVMSLSPIEE